MNNLSYHNTEFKKAINAAVLFNEFYCQITSGNKYVRHFAQFLEALDNL